LEVGETATALRPCCVDHPAIVVAGCANGLESLGFIPCEEHQLTVALQADAADPILPEREHTVLPGAVHGFWRIVAGASEIRLKGSVDSGCVDSENEVRGHSDQDAGLPNGSRLSCGALKKDSFLNLRAPPASSAC